MKCCYLFVLWESCFQVQTLCLHGLIKSNESRQGPDSRKINEIAYFRNGVISNPDVKPPLLGSHRQYSDSNSQLILSNILNRGACWIRDIFIYFFSFYVIDSVQKDPGESVPHIFLFNHILIGAIVVSN